MIVAGIDSLSFTITFLPNSLSVSSYKFAVIKSNSPTDGKQALALYPCACVGERPLGGAVRNL